MVYGGLKSVKRFWMIKTSSKQDVIQVIMRVLVLIKEIIVLVQKKLEGGGLFYHKNTTKL